MVKVYQKFDAPEVADVQAALWQELAKPGVGDAVKPGMKIAIAVGSRGVAEIPLIARVVVEDIKKRGGVPFVVPAMGSHGGATAEGQRDVLTNLGVTEESVGCPIVSCMDVVEVGKLDNGLAVLVDKKAYEADGIVIINRVKPHTAFRGPCESGLAKMLSIGLGKQIGADSCHSYGFGHMAEHVLEMAKIKLAKTNVLYGVATVENAYDRVAIIEAMPADKIIEADQRLVIQAKPMMPRIMFDPLDVLVVDQIGKEISGDGMDPNISGRFPTPFADGGVKVNKVVIRDLTEATHGNSSGMGVADFITRKLFDKIDFDYVYANCLTNTITEPAKVPVVMANDREALLAAVKTSNARDFSKIRIVRIKDTLHMGEILISETLLPEALANPNVEVRSEPMEMEFDQAGNLIK